MNHADRSTYPLRPLLFVALMALGFIYIATFAWLRHNSRDFVAEQLDAKALAAAQARPTADAELSFVLDGNGIELLGSGWQMPLSDGTWTQPDGAALYLPAAMAGASLRVHFVTSFYGGEEPVWVRLDVDGKEIAAWNPTPVNPLVSAELRLPVSNGVGTPLRVQFRIQRHAALFWHGVDPGMRRYGIRLTTMQLQGGRTTEQ